MDHIFITNELPEGTQIDGMIQKIAAGLLTPDMRAAAAAGCRFEIELIQEGKKITFKMRTVEKVSILKAPDGTPISVYIKR